MNRHGFEWFAYFSSRFINFTVFVYSFLKRPLLVLISNFSSKELDNSYKENIDLTRTRFVDQTKQVFVHKGPIIEKYF